MIIVNNFFKHVSKIYFSLPTSVDIFLRRKHQGECDKAYNYLTNGGDVSQNSLNSKNQNMMIEVINYFVSSDLERLE